MFGWHVPSPNQAMLISGSRNRGDAPFRIVVGHGAFALPVRNQIRFLTLAMEEAEGIPEFKSQEELDAYIARLENDMREAAKRFEFEQAAKLRDTIKELRTKEFLFA